MMAEYIERGAVLKALHSGNIDMGMVTSIEYTLLRNLSRKIDKIINSVPSADVGPVHHAIWVPIPSNFEDATLFACSKCKSEMIIGNRFNAPRYCSHCGAKMDTEGNNA
jgi:hypothetical protein